MKTNSNKNGVKIIAGRFRGISLDIPLSARATLSRAKQSLFDMLESSRINGEGIGEFFKDKTVLDCFAGSGAVSLEAISRGARHAFLVDINRNAIEIIKTNIEKTKSSDQTTVICSNISKIPQNTFNKSLNGDNCPCDLIFMDPPFNENIQTDQIIDVLIAKNWIGPSSVIIIESPKQIQTKFLVVNAKKTGSIEFFIIKIA